MILLLLIIIMIIVIVVEIITIIVAACAALYGHLLLRVEKGAHDDVHVEGHLTLHEVDKLLERQESEKSSGYGIFLVIVSGLEKVHMIELILRDISRFV